MPKPADCPAWDYEDFPNRKDIIERSVREVLTAVRSPEPSVFKELGDTRPLHWHCFRDLVWPEYSYFAGHYRGEDYYCLKEYDVMIRDDPRVGYPAASVLDSINGLTAAIRHSADHLNQIYSDPRSQLSDSQKIEYVVAIACQLFVNFLTIHPYANGNGHIGRFIIWIFLGQFGLWPSNWPVDPRPSDPPYSESIARHRGGHPEQLETWILHSLREN